METAYAVKYPQNMIRRSASDRANWPESTIHNLVVCVEDYARAKPLPFALWTFGIGFALGWKLKPW
jgi:hypothetical protein